MSDETILKSIEARLANLEVLITYLAKKAYAPGDPVVRSALGCIREQAAECVATRRCEPPMLRPGSVRRRNALHDRGRALGEQVLAAASQARQLRDELQQMERSGVAEDEREAMRQRVEDAEGEARDLAASARAELVGASDTEVD